MYVICGVHPGGNIGDGVFHFSTSEKDESAIDLQMLSIDENLSGNGKPTPTGNPNKRIFEVVVKINRNDLKTIASVRQRIITLQKKIRKLSRGSSDKVKINVEFY